MMGMPYNFQWGVDDDDSGAMFAHVEKSDGKSTSGQYRVTLPDGRVQVSTIGDECVENLVGRIMWTATNTVKA